MFRLFSSVARPARAEPPAESKTGPSPAQSVGSPVFAPPGSVSGAGSGPGGPAGGYWLYMPSAQNGQPYPPGTAPPKLAKGHPSANVHGHMGKENGMPMPHALGSHSAELLN